MLICSPQIHENTHNNELAQFTPRLPQRFLFDKYFLTCISIDAVITSLPYPNEKDYTRTTRFELCHEVEENRTLMTLIGLIYADKIK
jgi:hypothetical protein